MVRITLKLIESTVRYYFLCQFNFFIISGLFDLPAALEIVYKVTRNATLLLGARQPLNSAIEKRVMLGSSTLFFVSEERTLKLSKIFIIL